ncbi:RNA polymerase sigma factor [Peristeroidobacter soli]|uniref:RNA polymerase sigma factor n=1 Tax=Peristeroidobacter soli TaxID=2497877 RepID=UPI00101BA585|nr:sigma-70 family RNA polymerase sigma factor [Peristeroidobacter soli]
MASVSNTAPSTRERLDEIVRRYYAPLLSFFRKRTRNSPEVPDLVQQVFLRLAQRPDAHTVDNPDAYIFQTASNALKDHYRRMSVRERHIEAIDGADQATEQVPSELSPERVALGREAIARLSSALRELPERTRDVFILRCVEGLKHAEVAGLLGVSVRAVEKHSAKALAHLNSALTDEGVSSRE